MESLGRAVLRLVTDPSGLKSGLASARQDASHAARSIDGVLSNLGAKISSTLRTGGGQGFAIGASAGLTTGALGLLDRALSGTAAFIQDSIQAASDLNESASKSQVVFGSAAGAMDRFASSAAKGLGLSKQAALEAAATFGNFFTNLGQSQPVAEQMSEKIVTLAGDLASFNNIDPALALEKLRSGLSGEAEPLRTVGVFLTEAKVKAKAMQLGLADAHGELSEGAKVLARYQLILDETANAQGDFARTADGLANSQRVANAELVDVQAKFGEKLLPVQLAVTKGFTGMLGFVDALGDGLSGKLKPGSEEAYQAISTLTNGLSSILGPGGQVIKSFADQEAQAKHLEAAMLELSDVPGKIADDLAGGAAAVAAGADAAIRTPIVDAASDAWRKSREITAQTPVDIGRALVAGQDDVESAMETLKDAMTHPISSAKRIAHLEGILTGKQLAKGLRSTDPLVKADALALQEAVTHELDLLQRAAPGYGKRTARAYADALQSQVGYVQAAAKVVVGGAVGAFKASSPPGPESPLHEIDVWGGRTIVAWISGMLNRTSAAVAAGRSIAEAAGSGLAQLDAHLPLSRIQAFNPSALTPPGLAVAAAVAAAGVPAGAVLRPGLAPARGLSVVIEHIDASGHVNPAAVGSSVRQGVADAMAEVLRDESLRGLTLVMP